MFLTIGVWVRFTIDNYLICRNRIFHIFYIDVFHLAPLKYSLKYSLELLRQRDAPSPQLLTSFLINICYELVYCMMTMLKLIHSFLNHDQIIKLYDFLLLDNAILLKKSLLIKISLWIWHWTLWQSEGWPPSHTHTDVCVAISRIYVNSNLCVYVTMCEFCLCECSGMANSL